jgi:hypothetical protein
LWDSVSQYKTICGSKILEVKSLDAATLFNPAQITELIGRGFVNTTDCLTAMNGDMKANSINVRGTQFDTSNGGINVLFDKVPGGNIRVNWMLTYKP